MTLSDACCVLGSRTYSDQPICTLSSSRGTKRFSSRRSTILKDPHIDSDAQFGATPATLHGFNQTRRATPSGFRMLPAPGIRSTTPNVMEKGPMVLPKPAIRYACVSVTGRNGAGRGPPELESPHMLRSHLLAGSCWACQYCLTVNSRIGNGQANARSLMASQCSAEVAGQGWRPSQWWAA
jgi:hypothetical protein